MDTRLTGVARHCAYCGRQIVDAPESPERFGERFCSESHADEFVAGVRAARVQEAARREAAAGRPGTGDVRHCAVPSTGQPAWAGYMKRAACWGAPVLLLLAIPLVWSGGWAAAGGSLLSIAALLACPLGMYFMMRGMRHMPQQHGAAEGSRTGEDRRA